MASRPLAGFALVPNAKIIFLTEETSAEVVKEAFGIGARAYVQEVKAGRQLLAAIDAAIQGKRFGPNSDSSIPPAEAPLAER
jgi:DNA-binding NarL/FixJ family response regulator